MKTTNFDKDFKSEYDFNEEELSSEDLALIKHRLSKSVGINNL
jgi:hypothetical protein